MIKSTSTRERAAGHSNSQIEAATGAGQAAASDAIDCKFKSACERITAGGMAAVALSGGVDSALVLKAATRALGPDAIAITAATELTPKDDLESAAAVAKALGARHEVICVRVLDIPEVKGNWPNRCYECKKAIFSKIVERARELGCARILDGTNASDDAADRPGAKAILELGVESPLKEAGLSKAEVRECARRLGLEVWARPSGACLATRVAFWQELDGDALKAIQEAEGYLKAHGISQVRVRLHGKIARVEVMPQELGILLQDDIRAHLAEMLRGACADYVTMDLEGFRSGSMNATIARE